MKIAFISDAVYPYNKGGKELRLYEVTRRLAKRGHDIHIYTMKWWKGERIKQEQGVTLHAISPYYPLYTKSGRRSIKQALLFSKYIFPALLKEDFDILDVDQMPYFPVFPAWVLAKLRKKKMIVTWHEKWGKYWFEYLGLSGCIGYGVEKLTKFCTSRAIVVSQDTFDKLSIRKKNLIPNGIDLEEIKTILPSNQKCDILYVGRLIAHKNVNILVKVANKLGLNIIIMGSGPEEKRLRKIAKKNIQFTGFVKDQKDIFAQMKSAKVFVTLSEREGFGLSIIQALACGTPVITSNHKYNAGRFLIKHGDNGYLCSLKEKEVEETIRLAMRNVFKRKMIQESVKEYNWEAIVKKIEEVYNL